jgi:predicted transposase YbfD/YdcC
MHQSTVSPLSKLIEVFSEVDDPRIERSKIYPLNEVLFLTISAVISDCNGWDEIEDFGTDKLEWLRKYLPYSNGVPSHDTINRVMSLIDKRVFERIFHDWATFGLVMPDGSVINLDGKSLRGSANKGDQQVAHMSGGKSAKHIVHAWCGELKLCLGQYEVDEKSNEIKAIPQLLEMLDISGCIVTIDAMGCQRAITEQIVQNGGDFVIGVKENQPKLRTAIEAVFERIGGERQAELSSTEENRSHDRVETRTCVVVACEELPREIQSQWPTVKSVVKLTSIRKSKGAEDQFESRYYISSCRVNSAQMAQYIRQHWGVENSLHWVLDVSFHEDRSKKQTTNAATNYSIILKMSMNLLNQVEGKKTSMAGKRKKCARSDEFREKALRI